MILQTTSQNAAGTGSAKIDICTPSSGDCFIDMSQATGNPDFDVRLVVSGGVSGESGQGVFNMGCLYATLPSLQFTYGSFGRFYMQQLIYTSDTDIGINTAVDFTTTFTTTFSTACTAIVPVNVSTDNNASRLSCSIRAKRAGGFDFSVYSPAVATTVQWSYQFIAYGY
jgi:hypothetical protein